jgi:hypothetical protein
MLRRLLLLLIVGIEAVFEAPSSLLPLSPSDFTALLRSSCPDHPTLLHHYHMFPIQFPGMYFTGASWLLVILIASIHGFLIGLLGCLLIANAVL